MKSITRTLMAAVLPTLLTLLALLAAWTSFGQTTTATPMIREGNKLYQEKKLNEAEVSYRKALSADKSNKAGQYNLGNSLYKQGQYEGSSRQFNEVLQRKDLSKTQKAHALHNLGTSLLQEKKYNESIDAFKQSLKLDPADNDTRYNLAYAQSKLQQQQQQQSGSSDKNQQQKDQQKQQKQGQKDEKKDGEQEKSESAQNGEKKDQKQQGKSTKQGISKEDAEKILQALNNDEKKLQEKLNKKEAVRVRIEKNW